MYEKEIKEIKKLQKELQDKLLLFEKIYQSIYSQNVKFRKKIKELECKITQT